MKSLLAKNFKLKQNFRSDTGASRLSVGRREVESIDAIIDEIKRKCANNEVLIEKGTIYNIIQNH